MMPVAAPKVLMRPPGQRQFEWVDMWEAYVSSRSCSSVCWLGVVALLALTVASRGLLLLSVERFFLFCFEGTGGSALSSQKNAAPLPASHQRHTQLQHNYNTSLQPNQKKKTMNKVVFVKEPVTEDSANSLMALTLYLDSVDQKRIYYWLNCPGGEVVPTLAL